MSRAVAFKPRRIFTALLLLIVGFFLPFHFFSTSQESQESFSNIRCFGFEQLVQNPGVIQQDDPQLIDLIRQKILFYPSYYQTFDPSSLNDTRATPALSAPSFAFGQINQSSFVDAHLDGLENGFFVEAGAWDGEYLSNSLFFERERNWTGLLVEPSRSAFRQMLVNGRRKRATAANVCLSVRGYPEVMPFDSADVFGGVLGSDLMSSPHMSDLRRSIKDRQLYRVQCLPLYSLLLASGNLRVDFLSLDVEGAEFGVLRDIPFDKVDIRTLAVEVEHSDKGLIIKFMRKRGYRVLKRLKTDIIFVKKDSRAIN